MNDKLTEGQIQKLLTSKYAGNAKYKIPNIFAFDWESDYFIQKENDYCYEFEVKISRSDFFADRKKTEKIKILSTGLNSFNNKCNRPNKFFYILPEGLIKPEEIPSYAGYMSISNGGTITTIKEAPFLHKEKLDFSKNFCFKFYNKWICSKIEINSLSREIDRLKSLLKKHNIEDTW